MMNNSLKTLFDTTPVERAEISRWTDSYFTNTRKNMETDGDMDVTYAVFVRVPSMFAPRMAVDWLKAVAKAGNFDVKFESKFKPGDIVPAGEPQLYFTGSAAMLSECETIFLQKFGAVAVAAFNAYNSAMALPGVPFIAMGARHCVGLEMQEMMDYAASVGGDAAKREGAKGFVGGASDATAHFFGREKGMGTMPHNMIGYYNSTVKAAQRFRALHPEKPFTVLNDYFGREVTDAIEVAEAFPKEAANGTLSFRLDTNGARYLEGLDYDKSIEVIRENAPWMLERHLSEGALKILYGQGVSVAAVWNFRNKMAEAGFPNVGVIGSSGFGPEKCAIMASANAPLTAVGTGSYIPANFHDTYATADVFRYGTEERIKVGREYLIGHYHSSAPKFVL